MPESELVKIVVQAGAFGVLVFLTIWLCGWAFPAALKDRKDMVDKFIVESREQRDWYATEMRHQREECAREGEKRDQMTLALAKIVDRLTRSEKWKKPEDAG